MVEATVGALAAEPGVYNVGGGEEATLREAIELLERLAGRRLEVDYEPAALGDMRRTRADTTRIERAIGWRATTPLDQGLAAHWAWASSRVASR